MSATRIEALDLDAAGTRAAVKMVGFLAGLFLVLLCRLWWLQVLPQPQRLQVVALETNRPTGPAATRLLYEEPFRGTITDRAGRTLAHSWYAHDVVIDARGLVRSFDEDQLPKAGKRASRIIRRALRDCGIPYEARDLHRRILEAVATRDKHEILVRGLDPDERRRLDDRLRQSLQRKAQPKGEPLLQVSAFQYVSRLRRSYPWDDVTSQLVGLIGEAEADADERIAGRTGLEFMAEGVLAGRPGLLRAERDRFGRRLLARWAVEAPVRRGADLQLTIDAEIQHICMSALKQSVTERKATRGSAVVLDAQTGEILAAASYPTASPLLRENDDPKHLNAGAVIDLYEPGSVIKPVIVAWGLQQRKLRLDASWECGGSDGYHRFTDGRRGRTVREYRANPGRLTTEEVLIKSSNVGCVRILMSLGLKAVWEAFKTFGIAGRIDIAYPYEVRARYTTPQMIRTNPAYNRLNTECSFAQGYEIMLSPLGIARTYLAFTGDGTIPEPTLIKEIRGHERTLRPEPRRRRVIDASVAREMRRVLARVVEEGTGRVLKDIPWTAAAKTGTPKIMRTGKYNPTVCTFAPAANPKIVVCVVHQDISQRLTGGPYTGGKISGPVAKDIVTRTLDYLQVPTDK